MLLGYFATTAYIILVFILSIIMGRNLFRSREAVRKLVHIGISFVWFILYHFFKGSVHFVILPLVFLVLNSLFYMLSGKIMSEDESGAGLQSLFLMERTGEERTPGIVYYALSITIMALVSYYDETFLIPYGIGVFCMAFGDGMAGTLGKFAKEIRFGSIKIVGQKTLCGTLSCIVFSVFGEIILLKALHIPFYVLSILIIGVGAGLLELCGKGLDNITVPIGCMALARILLQKIY